MKYEPKILVNKSDKTVEFFCGGNLFIFEPGEQRPLDGYVAYHALKMVNTGLIEVGAEPEVVVELAKLEKMSWKDLRMVQDKKGKKVYQMGMNKKELIEAIKKCLV